MAHELAAAQALLDPGRRAIAEESGFAATAPTPPVAACKSSSPTPPSGVDQWVMTALLTGSSFMDQLAAVAPPGPL